ncbi:FecR domain-containing protein, partial [Spirochaetota bacterium]
MISDALFLSKEMFPVRKSFITILQFFSTDAMFASFAYLDIFCKVEKGQILTSLKKLKKNEQFNVTTPTAIAGVRGTSFMVNATSKTSKISVLTGSVQVTKGKKSVLVNQMKEIAVEEEIKKETIIRGVALADIKD